MTDELKARLHAAWARLADQLADETPTWAERYKLERADAIMARARVTDDEREAAERYLLATLPE